MKRNKPPNPPPPIPAISACMNFSQIAKYGLRAAGKACHEGLDERKDDTENLKGASE